MQIPAPQVGVLVRSPQATHWTALSCHRFRANEVRLPLSVLAYNLGNLWRGVRVDAELKGTSRRAERERQAEGREAAEAERCRAATALDGGVDRRVGRTEPRPTSSSVSPDGCHRTKAFRHGLAKSTLIASWQPSLQPRAGTPAWRWSCSC